MLTQSEISDALHEQTGLTAEQLDDIYTTFGKLNIEVVADIDSEGCGRSANRTRRRG